MIKRENHNLQMIRKFENPGKGIDRAANRPKGNFIESQAAAYLRRLGYEIIARNYAYQGGELDIVAKDGETIVFVEVKSVWNNQQGNPCRFDVLSARVYQKPLQFSHIKNAFEGTQVIPQC